MSLGEKDEESLYLGSLPMLDMDFTSKGITWVGNIYQKFETVCQDVYQEVDGIMTQEKAKYVESQVQTGCETVRKFCTEVMQDLFLPPESSVKAPVSDPVEVPVSGFSVNCNTDVEICKKTAKGFEECPLNEKTLPLNESEAVVPPGNDLMQAPLNAKLKEANWREDCVFPSEKSVPVSNAGKSVRAFSESHRNMPQKLQMSNSMAKSSENGHDQQGEPATTATVYSSAEIGRLNDFDWEEASKSTDSVEGCTDTEEEYEDLKLEANSIDAEVRDQRNLLPCQDSRKRSYKKKLRDALSLKLRFAKKKDGHYQRATLPGEFNTGIEQRGLKFSSSTIIVDLDPGKSVTQDFYESEWELL